jgi:hypothetical protein
MKGLIMLNKIKNIFLHNNNQITIRFADSEPNIAEKIKNLFNFYPQYAKQEIRIRKK